MNADIPEIDRTSCPFFETIYAGADEEYIQTELCKAVIRATSADMATFKRELIKEVRQNHSFYLGLCESTKQSYFNHSNRVLCALQKLFVGRSDISDALEPYFSDQSVFYYMGSYYSALWYGMNGTFPNRATIHALNSSHYDMISQMTEEAKDEMHREDIKNTIFGWGISILSVLLLIFFACILFG